MKKEFNYPPLEKGRVVCGQVSVVLDRLYARIQGRESELTRYCETVLLVKALEAIFPKLLTAQYGFVIDAVPVLGNGKEQLSRGEVYDMRPRNDTSDPLAVFIIKVPHSWLLHTESGTVIDVLPPGCEPVVTYPLCRPPHPNRPKYVHQPEMFRILQGRLPQQEQVEELRNLLENGAQDMASVFIDR